jgi:hypothetical protein
MSAAPRTVVADEQGPRLMTRVAAVMVVLALAGLAAYTMFSGPTTVSPPTGAGAIKAAPSNTTPDKEQSAEPGEGGGGR